MASAGFLTTHVPYDKPEDSRLRKYQLTDPYLKFYFAFIKSRLKQTKSGKTGQFPQIAGTPSYLSWLGLAFERFCIYNSTVLAKFMGFDGVNYRSGPYFKSKSGENRGVQIDLLFDRGDQTMIVCEMKYSRSPIKLAVAKETEKKVELIRQTTRKSVLPVLVTNSEPSKDLIKSGYFYKIIGPEAFF